MAKLSGIPQDDVARIYTYDVFNSLRTGRESDGYRVRAQTSISKIYGRHRLRILSAPMVTVQSGRIASESSDYMRRRSGIRRRAATTRSVARGWITHVTIHTAEGSYAGTICGFQNCSAQVSAHYVVRSSDGQITQMVLEKDKAWHVGSENSYTVGIEHEGYMSAPSTWFTDAMYNASALLTRTSARRTV